MATRVSNIRFRTGFEPLDELLQGLRPGDNVVWQVDRLEDYAYFARAFASQALSQGLDCVYLRFAAHSPLLGEQPGLTIAEIDPAPGFDYFTSEVHRIVEQRGKSVYYILDNISALVGEWATDESLANFFQVTCPFLYKIGALAYFGLSRGKHGRSAVTRIRNITQILLDVYHVGTDTYVHALKVWGRYSPHMFVPHRLGTRRWEPVLRSGDAASILSVANVRPAAVSSESIAPWDAADRQLAQYRDAIAESSEPRPEWSFLRESLARMMIGNQDKLNDLTDRYMTLDGLREIRDRLVGSGRVGGKAAGMLLARAVLSAKNGDTDFSQVLEEHDSFYIGSDVFFTFLVKNDLFQLRLDLSKTGRISTEEFVRVEQQFLAGQFPDEIMEQFRNVLDYYGQAPIIVRSSSLLEDGFSDAFAGKYRSEFCANQGNPDERLEAFVRAIKLVYASTLSPDALSYRHRRGFAGGDEQMAVLVQRVAGMPYAHYFFPGLAGVAFSRNLYAWTDRIDPRLGMIRLVFGLGTRAVNRVSGDYPRMIAVSHPLLRPEIGAKIARYSQHMVDVLNLESNMLETKPLADIIGNRTYPDLHLLTSEMSEGYLHDMVTPPLPSEKKDLVLTFNGLLKQTKLVGLLGEMLAKLESAWGQPVDVEFTAYINAKGEVKINLLQCRSLRIPKPEGTALSLPADLNRQQILFRSTKAINAGVVADIRYVVYVDSHSYAKAASYVEKGTLGRVIGKLNQRLQERQGKTMMLGPGRWGSTNIDLGVNATYADIAGTAVLVEIGHREGAYEPEVSFGTHFFQDLVESDILYLPVYPDESGSDFNSNFFESAANIVHDLAPDVGDFARLVKVIDVQAETNGVAARVVADPQTRCALCFLDQNQQAKEEKLKEENH